MSPSSAGFEPPAAQAIRGFSVKTADYPVYEPRAGDDQTRTTIYHVGDVVNPVKRETVRTP
jgi:hypothetical protein